MNKLLAALFAIAFAVHPATAGENEKNAESASKAQPKEDSAAKKAVKLKVIDETMKDGALKTGAKLKTLSK